MFLPKFKIILLFLFLLLLSSIFKTEVHAAARDIFKNSSLETFSDEERAAIARENEQSDPNYVSIYRNRIDMKFLLKDFPLILTNGIACVYTKNGQEDPELCKNHIAALPFVAKTVAYMYSHPPASGVGYAYTMLANTGIFAKPVYAQGIGFSGLTPFLPLWTAARNVAYAIIIVIMIVIGFMIIFRMKIDPKTVISVQAAIPKIILTLILITFSYAIVGFMIDVMYLVMGLTISMLAKGMGWQDQIAQLQTQYMNGDVGTLFASTFSAGLWNTVDDFFRAFNNIIGAGAGVALLAYIPAGPIALFIGAGVPAFLLFFLFLGILFTWIRLALLLFNSYVQLLISLILGPIFLLTEAIPGQSAFTQWILNIMANLVVFPATAAILMFALFLASSNITTVQGTTHTPIWSPPLTGFFGGEATGDVFPAFLAISVIFLAPQLVASVKKVFHPHSVLPVSMGTAFAPVTGAVSTGMGAFQSYYYIQASVGPVIDRIKNLVGGSGSSHQTRGGGTSP